MAEQIECNWCNAKFDLSEVGAAKVLWHSTASIVFQGDAGRVHQVSVREYKGKGNVEETEPNEIESAV